MQYLMKARVEAKIADHKCWKYGMYLDAAGYVELLKEVRARCNVRFSGTTGPL